MNKLVSGYLWAWTNYEAGFKSTSSLRKYYPDADIFVNVDYNGDIKNYKQICSTNNYVYSRNTFQLGYCGNFGNLNLGYEHWPRESTFEWLNRFYKACTKADSIYMLVLEEDDFVLKPITILQYDFDIAIHPTAPSPIGWHRPNLIPQQLLEYSKQHGGVGECPGYGAGGGTVLNRERFIQSWERCREYLWNDYNSLVQISKIVGWQDFILQYVMMLGGFQVVQNPYLCEHWEVGDIWKDFEIVTGLKDHTLVEI